jgi:regulator of protease activity HflC (stomatin/prohibitin superfamily)
MLFKQKVIIPETQMGLLFKHEQFDRLLPAGVHYLNQWAKAYQVETLTINELADKGIDTKLLDLAERHPEVFAPYLTQWETNENEVALIYVDKSLKDIKQPSQRGAYWNSQRKVLIKKLDISNDFKVDKDLAGQLLFSKNPYLRGLGANYLTYVVVPEGHVGFLTVNGEAQEQLAAGAYTWWSFNRTIQVTLMDCRLQNMEINGQEILTKDRVGLRINLSAVWQVLNPDLVKTSLVDHKDYLYRELQLALRAVVSTQTLDELLVDKNLLNETIQTLVAEKAKEYGLELKTVGARDIILPGEMKAILAQVVEAQKQAEANLIRRREETQETRSLHNTAKVMEGNPVLLRLKELEVLEKITSHISTLNVYGGLDGVMNDLVRLTDKTKPS